MWLNEGFAEYVSNIASHYIDPEIHTWERFYVEETQWVMYQDQDTRHHWAMTDPVTTRFYPFSTTIVHFQGVISNGSLETSPISKEAVFSEWCRRSSHFQFPTSFPDSH